MKKELGKIGNTPKFCEIYRGDSFQVIISNPKDALITALKIKAVLKSIQDVNVCMAIGMGNRTHNAISCNRNSTLAQVWRDIRKNGFFIQCLNLLIANNFQ